MNKIQFLVKNQNIKTEEVTSIESTATKGQLFIKNLMQTKRQLLIQITMSSDMIVPEHIHDHESIIYIIKGAVKFTIEGNEYIAKPGDVVYHPEGVPHTTHALEKSVFIEVKSPPKKTW